MEPAQPMPSRLLQSWWGRMPQPVMTWCIGGWRASCTHLGKRSNLSDGNTYMQEWPKVNRSVLHRDYMLHFSIIYTYSLYPHMAVSGKCHIAYPHVCILLLVLLSSRVKQHFWTKNFNNRQNGSWCGGVKLQLGKLCFEVQHCYQSNTAKHGVNQP